MSRTGKVRLVLVAVAAVVLAGCIRFAPPEDLPVSGGAALADVTGDGTADVLSNTASGLARYEYCGPGCLHVKEVVPGENVEYVADFNGDDADDIVSSGGSSLKILFGSATGLSAANAVAIPSSSFPEIAGIGDFNGDDKPDLLRFTRIFGIFGHYVAHLGDGAGGFTASTLIVITPDLSAELRPIGIGDIDGDGRDDIVSLFVNELDVMRLGDPQCHSEFGPYTCAYFAEENFAADTFTVGDIDSDGRHDVARYQLTTDAITFFRSTGTDLTPFPPYQTITVPASSTGIQMGLRDIDDDGAVDFVLNDGVTPRTWWNGSNNGRFQFKALTDVPVSASGCERCFGDVNGDGRLDAVTDEALWINTSD